MSVLINWVRFGFKAWVCSWMIFTQKTLLWAISVANNSPFIVFSISYFLWSIWMFGHTLLGKRSRNWWKRMSGWMSPAEWCPQNTHLAVLTSACTQGRNLLASLWLSHMVCDIFDVFSLLLPDEKMPGDISLIQQRKVKAARAGCVMELLPFLTTKGNFPLVLSNWLRRFSRNFFFSLSIVLIKSSLPP